MSNEEIAALEDSAGALRVEIEADRSREAYLAEVRAERARG